jgi:hypothetical protein
LLRVGSDEGDNRGLYVAGRLPVWQFQPNTMLSCYLFNHSSVSEKEDAATQPPPDKKACHFFRILISSIMFADASLTRLSESHHFLTSRGQLQPVMFKSLTEFFLFIF